MQMEKLIDLHFQTWSMDTKQAPIGDISEINDLMHYVKGIRGSIVTNFYSNPYKHNLWIKKDKLYVEKIEDTVFLICRHKDFNSLFFISPTFESLANSLKMFVNQNSEKSYVVDLIGKSEELSLHCKVFSNLGFIQRTALVRMSMPKHSEEKFLDGSITRANEDILVDVETLLHQYFDKYVEQIPMTEELLDWIRMGQVLVYNLNGEIGGFLIFDNIGHTAFLRYWFVHPDYRNSKVGSKLINSFFALCKSSERYIFWVIKSNDNAIQRYLHYGFRPESLTDIVMTFNVKSDE
jgi:GNAT superfamily N-acetyltransferase